MLNRRRGRVRSVQGVSTHIQRLLVEIDGELVPTVNYRVLAADVHPGDLIEVNTTAVDLGLGTGGTHFLISRIDSDHDMSSTTSQSSPKETGHIMKLRYTPLQLSTLSVEEESSLYHGILQEVDSLEGMPVLVGSLHSLIAPAAAVLQQNTNRSARLVYVMTDGAALPLGFSRLVASLQNQGLISATITIGHAFGGDLEAVNIYSALLAGRHVLKADACIVAMGPGVVGTGTPFGTTAMEIAGILDGVNALGGRAVAIPRISFADERPRHYGISHHTLTALGKLCHSRCFIPFPQLHPEEDELLRQQCQIAALDRHHLSFTTEDNTLQLLQDYDLHVTSMGRTAQEDPAFFRAGGAAGRLAAEWILSAEKWEPKV